MAKFATMPSLPFLDAEVLIESENHFPLPVVRDKTPLLTGDQGLNRDGSSSYDEESRT